MNASEEYTRMMREKRIAELEQQVAKLEHDLKNERFANTVCSAWKLNVNSVSLHGDFEVRLVFSSCRAACAFENMITEKRHDKPT